MDQKPQSFIFYLSLEDKLPETFYIFDRTLRDLGFMLIPVKVDQLQSLISSTEQNSIIVLSSVSDSREYELYNKTVRLSLKYLLQSKRIRFLLLSSFSRLDDSKVHVRSKNYFFLRYPLDARILAAAVARFYESVSQKSTKWPGGTRAGVRGLGVA